MDIKDIFNNKIKWSFHTCMDMDVAFQLMLMGGQYSAPIESESDISMEKISKAVDIDSNIDIAFFYNAKSAVKQGSVSIGRSKSIPVQNAEKYRYGLNCKNRDGKDQTFHAKISLLCYECDEGDSYRIGVYSKNMTFSGEIFEVGGVYAVDFCESEESCKAKNNRDQLVSFLNKIYVSSNEMGQKWLGEHDLYPSGKIGFLFCRPFRLRDIKSGKEVELLFGGCGKTHLYKHIGLMEDNVDRKETIVLTPPFFVKQTRNIDEFTQSKPSKIEGFLQDTDKPEDERIAILYDLNDKKNYSASHAKVYLVTKGEDYSYFQGSANCTPRGIGVSNKNGKWEKGFESVEVLVKYSLDKNEFDCIRDDIIKKGFTNSIDINKSRPITNDNELAKWLTSEGKVTSVIYYDKEGNEIHTGGLCSKIEFIIELPKQCPKCGEYENLLEWYPLEYGSAESVITRFESQNQQISLVFQKKAAGAFRIQPTQQTLVICGYAMMIPEELLYGIPKPEGTDGGVMDVYVTKLLWDCKNEDEIKEKIEEYINRVAKSGDKDTEKAKTVKSALEALKGK